MNFVVLRASYWYERAEVLLLRKMLLNFVYHILSDKLGCFLNAGDVYIYIYVAENLEMILETLTFFLFYFYIKNSTLND